DAAGLFRGGRDLRLFPFAATSSSTLAFAGLLDQDVPDFFFLVLAVRSLGPQADRVVAGRTKDVDGIALDAVVRVSRTEVSEVPVPLVDDPGGAVLEGHLVRRRALTLSRCEVGHR